MFGISYSLICNFQRMQHWLLSFYNYLFISFYPLFTRDGAQCKTLGLNPRSRFRSEFRAPTSFLKWSQVGKLQHILHLSFQAQPQRWLSGVTFAGWSGASGGGLGTLGYLQPCRGARWGGRRQKSVVTDQESCKSVIQENIH